MSHWQRENFTISTEKSKLDHDVIYQFLKQSYWAEKRKYEQVVDSIKHSMCFGVYEHND